MLYAGDIDMACNFLGGEMFAEAMGLNSEALFYVRVTGAFLQVFLKVFWNLCKTSLFISFYTILKIGNGNMTILNPKIMLFLWIFFSNWTWNFEKKFWKKFQIFFEKNRIKILRVGQQCRIWPSKLLSYLKSRKTTSLQENLKKSAWELIK